MSDESTARAIVSRTRTFLKSIGHLRDRYFRDYIFIHINKTGGSSIEKALRLTFEHRTAQEKRDELGENAWHRKFTFTVVRNPWDRVASHYFYRVKTNQTGLGDGHMGFNAWVRRAYGENAPDVYDRPKMFMPQVDWIVDEEGNVIVDFIARFENLQSDFEAICRRLRLHASLPHLKSSGKGDYRGHYDNESIEVVRHWFQRDIALFGYQFDADAGQSMEQRNILQSAADAFDEQ